MVQIYLPIAQTHPATSSSNSNDPHWGGRNWALVELQGTIEPVGGSVNTGENDNEENETKDRGIGLDMEAFKGVELGQVQFGANGNPYLIIGHNRLEGKKTTLPKPLAVIRKVSSTSKTSNADRNDPTTPASKQQRLPFNQLSSFDATSSSHLLSSPTPKTPHGRQPASSIPNTGGLQSAAAQQIEVFYEVVTVFKHKYLFKSRPEVIVNTNNVWKQTKK